MRAHDQSHIQPADSLLCIHTPSNHMNNIICHVAGTEATYMISIGERKRHSKCKRVLRCSLSHQSYIGHLWITQVHYRLKVCVQPRYSVYINGWCSRLQKAYSDDVGTYLEALNYYRKTESLLLTNSVSYNKFLFLYRTSYVFTTSFRLFPRLRWMTHLDYLYFRLIDSLFALLQTWNTYM